jgi:hypothetical protein
MKKAIVLCLLAALGYSVNAQDTLSKRVSFKNEFGFHVGSTTAVGLSLRHWFGKNGMQLTVLPPIKKDDYKLLSFGLTFLHSYYEWKYFRFYGYVGSHYWCESYTRSQDNSAVKYETISLGIGPGASFGKVVRINVMCGYGMYDILGEFNTYPAGEIGVYYLF